MEWISVKDRLPKDGCSVLAIHDHYILGCRPIVAYYDKEKWRWSKTSIHPEISPVTHWMPLAEPPKEELLNTPPACKYKNGDLVYFVNYTAYSICAGLVSEIKVEIDPWGLWVHKIQVNNHEFHHHLDIYASFKDAHRALSIYKKPREV